MPANFVAPPSIPEDENWVTSQCPEFYAEDALMLSQVIYLGLLWLGLIVLLNPGVTIGKFTKKYLKPRWWLIINSMWIWVVIPHHLETASYYPVISVTTKERQTKKAKASKVPTSSSGKKKEASKQASKNPSPPPPNGSSPPSSSDPQDEQEDYSKKFKASGHVAWDPLAIHNICNVDREFKVPKRFPWYFPIMSVKGGPGYVANNYIFNCNNQKRQTKSKHFVCKDKTCRGWLNTKGWEQVMLEKGEHTFEPPNHLITHMLKWCLVQVIPTTANLCASDLAIKALHTSQTQQSQVGTNTGAVGQIHQQ
ncbi:hypothetical protein DSO57_1036910 [Entomophthora muscae]|uniref:Uncharacterized protein n=1 Tax=Entomophthora muscae TaxID=34485 RepID=A0ACC2TA14_9FUNG|nr:hypothetical protein DSO57_1036910 [Entomophthora muscae]